MNKKPATENLMGAAEQTQRVIASGGNDIFFVIAGRKSEWKMWASAYKTACNLEHRLDRNSITTNQFKAHVGPYQKMVTYRYLTADNVQQTVEGAGSFLVVRIGTYQQRWSKDALHWLSYASQASMQPGYFDDGN